MCSIVVTWRIVFPRTASSVTSLVHPPLLRSSFGHGDHKGESHNLTNDEDAHEKAAEANARDFWLPQFLASGGQKVAAVSKTMAIVTSNMAAICASICERLICN